MLGGGDRPRRPPPKYALAPRLSSPRLHEQSREFQDKVQRLLNVEAIDEIVLFSLKHLRDPKASDRLKIDSGCLSVERVPDEQYDEPLHVEQMPACTGLDGKSRFKGFLFPCSNLGQSP